MKIEIIYESKTGNTKLIAESIKEAVEEGNKVTFKSIDEKLEENNKEDIDLYFLGSWTNKGDCGEKINEFCKSLKGQKIALFGTAGFGGSEEYYKNLSDRFSDALPENNEIVGYFYSQGKMPTSIRDRYMSILRANPEDKKLQVSIENFDQAQSHPDSQDIERAKEFARDMIDRVKK